MHDVHFRILFLALLLVAAAIRVWGFWKAESIQKARLLGNDIAMLVPDLLIYTALLGSFVYVMVPDLAVWMVLPLPSWARALGTLIEAVGLALLVWTHLALGADFSPNLRIRQEHRLVTSGPFRFVRHPMYVGGFLIMLGGALLSQSVTLGGAGITAMVWICWRRVPNEEAMMVRAFGTAYETYAKATPRFFPAWPRR